MATALISENLKGWEANLDLSFAYRNNKTTLTGKKHSGPLMVQKPFYPEPNGCCHVYLIHPPGGIVGGDVINFNAKLEEHTHALITTPGATKFYRSIGPVAEQNQTIYLQDNAVLEWLPQETVYFNNANSSVKTKIHLKNNNRFFAWEIQCIGLPAQKDYFISGQCKQKFEIWRNDTPLFLETNNLIGDDPLLNADWGLQSHKSLGTFITSCQLNETELKIVTTIIAKHDKATASYTQVNNMLVIRAMSSYAEKIKLLFTALWQALRPKILDIESSSPRIWYT